MAQYKMLDGNGAAVQAVSMADVKVVAAYPITPQSPIAEKLSDMIARKTMDAQFIRVESEHSALSCALGAQLTGIRAATATASVGLALMHEICNAVSGMRIPMSACMLYQYCGISSSGRMNLFFLLLIVVMMINNSMLKCSYYF